METKKKHNRRVIVKIKPRSKLKVLGLVALGIILMAASMGPAHSNNRNLACIQPDVTGDSLINVLDMVTMSTAITNAETDNLCVQGVNTTSVDVDVVRGQIAVGANSPELIAELGELYLATGSLGYDWEYVLKSGEISQADGIRFTLAPQEENISVISSFGSEFLVDSQGNFLEPISIGATAIDSQRLLLPPNPVQGAHYTRAADSVPYTPAMLTALNEANERSSLIFSGSNRVIGAVPLAGGASLLIIKRNLHNYVLPTNLSYTEGSAFDARGVLGHSPGINEQVGATWAYYVVTQDGSTVLVAEAASIMGSDFLAETMGEVLSENAQGHPINVIIRLNFDRSTIEDTQVGIAILNALDALPTDPTHLFADYLPGAEIRSAYSLANDPCENVEQ